MRAYAQERSLVETTSQAPTEPVTLAEAKLHLRKVEDDEDSRIASLISAARIHVEQWTRRALVPKTFELTLGAFPSSPRDPLVLPKPPLTTVESVAYLDTDGGSQALAVGSEIFAAVDREPGALFLPFGSTWPATRDVHNAVTVAFSAGYGDADDTRERTCPASLKQAILLLVGHWFENREEVVTGTIATQVPRTVRALVWPHRVLVL